MIELGELRNQFSLDMQRKIVQILNDHQNQTFYYLLVNTRHDPVLSKVLSKKMGGLKVKAIKTTFMIRNDLPPFRLLGTFCYYVNNRTGVIKRMWALPLDAPKDEKLLTNDGVEEVLENAKGMPIFY